MAHLLQAHNSDLLLLALLFPGLLEVVVHLAAAHDEALHTFLHRRIWASALTSRQTVRQMVRQTGPSPNTTRINQHMEQRCQMMPTAQGVQL